MERKCLHCIIMNKAVGSDGCCEHVGSNAAPETARCLAKHDRMYRLLATTPAGGGITNWNSIYTNSRAKQLWSCFSKEAQEAELEDAHERVGATKDVIKRLDRQPYPRAYMEALKDDAGPCGICRRPVLGFAMACGGGGKAKCMKRCHVHCLGLRFITLSSVNRFREENGTFMCIDHAAFSAPPAGAGAPLCQVCAQPCAQEGAHACAQPGAPACPVHVHEACLRIQRVENAPPFEWYCNGHYGDKVFVIEGEDDLPPAGEEDMPAAEGEAAVPASPGGRGVRLAAASALTSLASPRRRGAAGGAGGGATAARRGGATAEPRMLEGASLQPLPFELAPETGWIGPSLRFFELPSQGKMHMMEVLQQHLGAVEVRDVPSETVLNLGAIVVAYRQKRTSIAEFDAMMGATFPRFVRLNADPLTFRIGNVTYECNHVENPTTVYKAMRDIKPEDPPSRVIRMYAAKALFSIADRPTMEVPPERAALYRQAAEAAYAAGHLPLLRHMAERPPPPAP